MRQGNRLDHGDDSEVTPLCWRATIPECPPSANVLIRTHFRERKKDKEKFYALLYGAFFHENVSKAKGKRKVKLWLRSKRSRDYANLFLGADKYILDNLKRLGWIIDDNPKWLDLEVVGEVGEPQTVIEISEVIKVTE